MWNENWAWILNAFRIRRFSYVVTPFRIFHFNLDHLIFCIVENIFLYQIISNVDKVWGRIRCFSLFANELEMILKRMSGLWCNISSIDFDRGIFLHKIHWRMIFLSEMRAHLMMELIMKRSAHDRQWDNF